MELFPKIGISVEPDANSMGFYLLLWGIFSTGLVISIAKTAAKSVTFVFGTLGLLFYLEALQSFTNSEIVLRVAGIEGIVCGTSGLYVAFALLMNE